MRTLDWKSVEEKAKGMTIEMLRYAILDCREAELASRGWNPENEGYYSDEASVYSKELRKRAKLVIKERESEK